MNIFILNTGRCASTSWIKACHHITNYSCGHESLAHQTGNARLAYPLQHIEADNRLSWFLGRLDEQYAGQAFYVHLSRNTIDTVNSFVKRSQFGIMQAYRQGILLNTSDDISDATLAKDYIDTVESNIRFFLKDKPLQMNAYLENIQQDFERFWQRINAQGDLSAALLEFDIRYNQS